jgi:hypothetical protein
MKKQHYNAKTYNATKDLEKKTVQCMSCRKEISWSAKNCVGFGLYECTECRNVSR